MSVRKREKLLSKIIVSVLAAGSLYGLGIGNINAYAEDLDGTDKDGQITVEDGNTYSYIYGFKETSDVAEGGNVIIENATVSRAVYGGYSVYNVATNNTVTINNGTIQTFSDPGFGVYGGYSAYEEANHNIVNINNGNILANVYGGCNALGNNAKYNIVNINGGTVSGNVYGGSSNIKETSYNAVNISGGIISGNVYGGYGINDVANNNTVNINGGTVSGNIYGGYNDYGDVNSNTITLEGTPDIASANLYGSNKSTTATNNNDLDIDGFTGTVNSLNNFNNINLNNIQWQNNGTVLEVLNNNQTSDLSNTNINVNNLTLQGGSTIQENDTMNLISGKNLNIDKQKVTLNFSDEFTAGVTAVGRGIATVNNDTGLSYTISSIALNPQTKLIAENRAVAAAFINQGSDLISSGLDSLHDQYGYGFKTFAAVYGNRSTYDAGGDLKINGWSEIIGLGSSKEFDDGDLDWGVFYENGSGNYRTYNQFNDEFFRGDGSMVYNGGGVAARFTKGNGWYYEGSLRAGTLKSEIDNALKDGNGNMYGYKSDTTYYGAHLGLGKIVELNDSQDLNVYGKYFHTYNDGDEFTIAGDKFSFDSVTSDRIMLGAKITTNKNNTWKTHYGLAWEYEFNGDSDMRAGQFDVPTQSLKGSTFIGEVGFSYQDKSPWSFDISLKGYQGERDGFSGHAQATYNF